MKKILASLLTILLLTFAFVSCNLDGTSGIFREIALSKAPLSIRYKQLLGINGTDLYFRTANGVERVTTAKVNTRVATSTFENIIQAAALYTATDKLFFITNNEPERTGNIVNVVDTTDPSFTKSPITVTSTDTTSSLSGLSIKSLYANSMIMVTGNSGVTKIFELLLYDTVTNNFKSTTYGEFISVPVGYDVENVIQQTAKEQDATAPMLVSFVNGTGSREHYLVNPAGAALTSLGTENVKIANFFYYNATNIFVLTTDGDLYHVNQTTATWTSIGSSSKVYEQNAFALAVVGNGALYHFITKPSSKTSAIHVFTIDTASPLVNIGAGVDVSSGYAEEISLATIVSAQQKLPIIAGTTDLLVATEENGMYDISITNVSANVDDGSNGLTLGAEEYSF
ncbi:MAG: hypothetical protein WBI82_07760 [Sphaerochaeta sp.]